MQLKLLSNKLGALVTVLDDLSAVQLAGLGKSASAALLTVHHRGPITIGELARIVDLSHPATVRVADRLQAAGLVDRQRRGGREVHLVVTQQGQDKADALERRRSTLLSNLLQPLDQVELVACDRIVDRLLASLVDTPAAARRICRFCDHQLCTGARCPAGTAARALDEDTDR